MANGETPPVKERLEMPVATQKTDTGLTPGLLKVLHKQVHDIIRYNNSVAAKHFNMKNSKLII